jgi:hypothetical protein
LTVQHNYSRVRNKRTSTLIIFLTFFQGLRPYSGLHRAYLSGISIRYKWSYAYYFCQIFQGLRLFQTLEYSKVPVLCTGLINITTHKFLPNNQTYNSYFQVYESYKYRGSLTYTKITNTVSTTTVLLLYMFYRII